MFYGRFLRTNTINNPTIAIAIIIATVEIAKYVSVGGKEICCIGDAVGVGLLTANDDSAYDGQYDSEPANDAMTVYEP
jgi:hypothetical protein